MADVGLGVDHVGPGRATMTMPPRADWLGDPVRGQMHPGAITVLADTVCGLGMRAAMPVPGPVATLDLRMDFLRAASPARATHCEAECYRLTREIAFMRATAWQDDRGEPVAIGHGAFMRIAGEPRGQGGHGGQGGGEGSAAAAAAVTDWAPPGASEPLPDALAVPYLRYLGVRHAPDGGNTLYRLPFAQRLVGNPAIPALHGGVVAGFAEIAAMLYVIDRLPREKIPKLVDFSMDYLRSGRPQETFAQCELVRLGSRVALVQVRCWQVRPEYPIAVARGHLLIAERG